MAWRSRRFARSPLGSRPIRLVLEMLETRAIPAVIDWINPAGGSWNLASNWDLGRVPQPDDDVVIRTLDYSAHIDHASGTDTIQSISTQLDEATLAVTDSSSLQITGAVNIPILKASTGGEITANTTGSLHTNLLATDGGAIHLPALTSYNGNVITTLAATGMGSLIDLPSVTSLLASTGNTVPGEIRLDLSADQGGIINLPALTSVYGHPPNFIIGVTALRASNGGTFLLDTTGSITFDASAYLMVDSGADLQAGDIVMGGSGELTVNGSLEANSVAVQGNAIIGGAVTVNGDFTMNQSTLSLQAGTVTVGDLFDNEGGMFYGSGIINGTVENAGMLNVGALAINGDYVQTASGQLSLHLRSASDFDELVVTGFATLDGTLNLILANGYQPQPGDQLQVVQFGAGTGAFAQLGGNAPLVGVLYIYQPDAGYPPGVTLLF